VLKKLAVLTIGVGVSLASSAAAQEHNHPALNAVGRFWGFGWSNGYHAGAYDGRFQHVKDNHPASMYGSNALLYPYQAGYEPARAYMQANQGYGQPGYSGSGYAGTGYTGAGDSQVFGSILQGAPNQPQQSGANRISPTPAAAIPTKPVEPPPTWLRPFLKDESKANAELPKPKAREEADAAEASPSDLLQPKSDSPAPTKKERAKASDDDDLLTLTPKSALEHYNEARRKQNSNR
jgi:hypothetical protein